MRNPIPSPIIIPATGAPTCRGVALRTPNPAWYYLRDWARDSDLHMPGDTDALVRVRADRAIRDGMLLCLRPTADRPACVGLSATAFAVSSLQDDFAVRALVVDPYDADGNDLRLTPANIAIIYPNQRMVSIDQIQRWACDDLYNEESRSVDDWRQIPPSYAVAIVDYYGAVTVAAGHGLTLPQYQRGMTVPGAPGPVQVADMSPGLTEEEAHDVAVWEASERT